MFYKIIFLRSRTGYTFTAASLSSVSANRKTFYKSAVSERRLLEDELKRQASTTVDIPLIIGGKEIRTGKTGKV